MTTTAAEATAPRAAVNRVAAQTFRDGKPILGQRER